MGLDMYLYRKTYVSDYDGDGESYEERQNNSSRKQLKITGLRERVNPSKVVYIVEEVGYWRKANAIHQWFVQNVQGGEDDCKPYYVDSEKLRELLSLCERILSETKLIPGKVHTGTSWDKDGKHEHIEEGKVVDNPELCAELLPTTAGFFFGGTDYDEWYYKDIENTRDIINECLNMPGGEYEYQSSW